MRTLMSILAILSISGVLVKEAYNKSPLPHVVETEGVTFDGQIKSIVLRSCIECHYGGSNNFSKYQNAYQMRYTILRRVVIEADMPLGHFLSDEDRALFRDWVKQGSVKN